MKGRVKNIVATRNFGFITADGIEYFFHREDFNGHWDDLVMDMEARHKVEVEFQSIPSPKGPRANEVRRTDFPN